MDYRKLLFDINIPSGHSPAGGMLLVAEPFLRERYFNHTVITLIDYEQGGTAMGVVMNNLTDYSLQELINDITLPDPVPVYCGGPVGSDRLFFLHTLGDVIPGSSEVCPGLYVGGDFEEMTRIINDGYPLEGHVRFFIGYSGWSERQLDEEIANNVWAVGRPSDAEEMLTGHGDPYWHRYVRSLGPDFRGWLYHPRNPSSN